MKNKPRYTIIISAVVILVAAIVVGIWIYSNRISPEEKISEAIAAAWDEATANDDPNYLQEIEKVSSYEIIELEKGDYYTVHVAVTGIDLGTELENLTQEDLPEDEEGINALLVELISRCPQVETTTVIYAEPTEDGFDISFSDTFVDAMSGKIYSYYMNQIEEITGGA